MKKFLSGILCGMLTFVGSSQGMQRYFVFEPGNKQQWKSLLGADGRHEVQQAALVCASLVLSSFIVHKIPGVKNILERNRLASTAAVSLLSAALYGPWKVDTYLLRTKCLAWIRVPSAKKERMRTRCLTRNGESESCDDIEHETPQENCCERETVSVEGPSFSNTIIRYRAWTIPLFFISRFILLGGFKYMLAH